MSGLTKPLFSIVIPTFRRRDTVVESVRVLSRQTFSGSFEAIIVIDGSDDGSAEALGSLEVPFPLKIIEQANAGAASARNRGAREASGEFILFLDDDMVAHPNLLTQHYRTLGRGADAVLGHLPLHPDSPKNFLSKAVGQWAEQRARTLQSKGGELTLLDLLTGQLSIRRELFEALGGFDAEFTHNGSFGGEDTDFGHRLLQGGYRVIFDPEAISYQRYVVTFRQFLRQWYQAGQADAALARKHPEIASRLLELHRARARWNRLLLRPLARLPIAGKLVAHIARVAACALAERWPRSDFVYQFFHRTRDLLYWRGMVEAGGIRFGRTLRVLAYHSISRIVGAPKLADYVIDPSEFARQLGLLQRMGFHFVSPAQAVAFLRADGPLPPRAVLVTFDDGFLNLKEEAAGILHKRRVPAVVFVVTRLLGATNVWDEAHEPNPRRLMSEGDLQALRQQGVEVGAHSRHHRSLRGLSSEELKDEIDGSLEDLAQSGLSSRKLFCYPYGSFDDAVEERVRAAGAAAAFTVDAGIARRRQNSMRVPRLEILRSDGSGLRFLCKVVTGLPLQWNSLRSLVAASARSLTPLRAHRSPSVQDAPQQT